MKPSELVSGWFVLFLCMCMRKKKKKKFQSYTHIGQNKHNDLCLNGAPVFVCGVEQSLAKMSLK